MPVTMRVEQLASHHDRAGFNSGSDVLDRYFRERASQDARKNIAATFVLLADADQPVGFYTLSATSLLLAEVPQRLAAKLPRYPQIPAILIGRLAVDQGFQGKGGGRFMLADALWRCARSEIAAYAIVVDAKDETARAFYEKESFLSFPDNRLKLFRPMADIKQLFS